MKEWLAAFPEFSSVDLFLTGESYAGIYIPTLAREILGSAPSPLASQLKGIAIGDGCLGNVPGGGGCTAQNGPYFQVEFYHGHGQFSDKTYEEIQRACSRKELVDGVTTPSCKAALDGMDKERGYNFEYNLYDECYDFALSESGGWREQRSFWGPRIGRAPASQPSQGALEDEGSSPRTQGRPWHMDGSPCGGTGTLPLWLNATGVRRALHVAENAKFFTGDNGANFIYNFTEPSLLPWYKEITEASSLRVLVYNGDADPILNSFFAQNWTASVGLPVKEAWRPWTRDGKIRMGGFVTRYEKGFDFLTIRGAGHMVPEYKPEAAFVMLKSFVSNADYPAYSPKSAQSEEAGHDLLRIEGKSGEIVI
mmetsp:Transcript_22096/g.48842  ORF Transcript_22096/g.48842 Transcript_22096/m.48842 type:complete len:366 (+) Transcript_22096:1-1098(+)